MRTLILFLAFFSFLKVTGQTSNISWQNSYGGTDADDARSIRETNDGYLVCGSTRSINGNVSANQGINDIWLIKIGKTGNLIWEKTYGGFSQDLGHSMNLTADGGCIIGGVTTTIDLEGTNFHGWTDAYVIKVDSAGNLEWQKTYGGPGPDHLFDIHQISDGGYIFAGCIDSVGGDVTSYHGGVGADVWLVKLNDTGAIEWDKSLGGTRSEIGYSVQQTTDGGFVVGGFTGSVDGDVSIARGSTDAWIVKLSSLGIIEWENTFTDTSSEIFWSIEQTSDGGYIAAGASGIGQGPKDFFIVKTDQSGALQWSKKYGGSAVDFAYTVRQALDGGYIASGRTYSNDGDVSFNHSAADDLWVTKLDATGNLQWEKSYGGQNKDVAYSIIQAKDSNFIFCGTSNSTNGDVTNNHGNVDFWVVKLGSVINEINTLQEEKMQVTVYPTITNGRINIFNPQNSIAAPTSVRVHNAFGVQVLSEVITRQNSVVDLSGHSRGLYLVEIGTNGKREVIKVLLR